MKENISMGMIDGLKVAGKVLQEAGKIEQYQQILDAQQQLLEMQNRIGNLEKENAKLQEQLKIKEALVFDKNAYWIHGDEHRDGPFCSCCWDDARKTIRMQPCGNPAYFDCPRCANKDVQIYPDAAVVHQQEDDFDRFSPI